MPLYTNIESLPETEKRMICSEQVLAAVLNGAAPSRSFLETLSEIERNRFDTEPDVVRVKLDKPSILPSPQSQGEWCFVKYGDNRRYKFRSIRILFEPRDAWIGVYWTFQNIGKEEIKAFKIYICIVPFLPIVLTWTNSFIE